MTSNKSVFAALTGPEIAREYGRLPYPVLRAFVDAGYRVRVHTDLRQRLLDEHQCDEADLPQASKRLLALPGLEFVDHVPDDDEGDALLLYDRPLDAAMRRRWRKRVQVRYDLFAPYRLRAPIIAPYPMYLAHTERFGPDALRRLRETPRAVRVLFAGDSQGYVRQWVRYPAPKLPRAEILRVLRQRLPDAVVDVAGEADIGRLRGSGYTRKFVLSDSGSGIDQAQWLPTLATADFFLCPPGIVMPMCHNLIEAMAVGAIPLINYPEWLQPDLVHGDNCVAFGDADDLVQKMQQVLVMPDDQIQRLRARVIDYYETHLQPGRIVDAVESRPERDLALLIYTELNMARHSKQLGRHSVVIRGPDAGGPLRWLGRAIDRRLGRLGSPPPQQT